MVNCNSLSWGLGRQKLSKRISLATLNLPSVSSWSLGYNFSSLFFPATRAIGAHYRFHNMLLTSKFLSYARRSHCIFPCCGWMTNIFCDIIIYCQYVVTTRRQRSKAVSADIETDPGFLSIIGESKEEDDKMINSLTELLTVVPFPPTLATPRLSLLSRWYDFDGKGELDDEEKDILTWKISDSFNILAWC